MNSDLADDHKIREALALAERHPDPLEGEQLAAFIPLYYQRVPAEELRDRRPADLYGAALSHWHLATRGDRPLPRLRVYNPSLEEDAWQSRHSVVEVVCADQPFLIDSLRMALNGAGLTVHLSIHPVLSIRHDRRGRLMPGAGPLEDHQHDHDRALVHLEIDHHSDPAELAALHQTIEQVLADVDRVVRDWQPMQQRLTNIVAEFERLLPKPPAWLPDLDEELEFLRWLGDNHFAFLGYREFELTREQGQDSLWLLPDTGLGFDRGHSDGQRHRSSEFQALPPAVRALAHQPALLILTKASQRSTVHRPVYMDYVGIRRFDPDGRVTGEHRFLGLYASTAYSASVQAIPLVRRKARRLIESTGLRPNGHSAKALLHIIETFPRDQLLQSPPDELLAITQGILHLEEHQRIRLFVTRDPFQRFYSCLLYVPRDRYHTALRQRLQRLFKQAFQADTVEFSVHFSESVLARIHFIIHCDPVCDRDVDLDALEQQVISTLRSWDDDLHDALIDGMGEERGNRLHRRYQDAFDSGYKDRYAASLAVHDIDLLERMCVDRPGQLAMNLYHPAEAAEGLLRFKLFRCGDPIPLSDALPMLENMGVQVIDEHPYCVNPRDSACIALHDFGLRPQHPVELDNARVKPLFQECFQRVWFGDADNDGFNRLVLLAQLDWRQVNVLRVLSRYLKQVHFTFSQSYIEQTLAANPALARLLVELFEARLEPAGQDRAGTRVTNLLARITEDLDAVAALDQDRILRRLLSVIQAVLRCNYFQRGADGQPKPYLSIKLDPGAIPDLPQPRPRFEIFVCSPRTEGVHLRAGPVARGGLRWSDRLEDYRTEVLGLMKAQVVKNAVIVPVGAKGGFVVKRPPTEGGREAIQQEVVDCYRTFIGGLLDLTDNRIGERVVPPPDLVRHDGDDPYLVVAADKGTASFSDIANRVAADYRFWLGDGFASGGSAGYDHKAMGITARGAWESVKRLFLQRGIDIQTTPFTVIGIGDMSGDVFGNGMLLSPQTRLVAAFDHRHIFIDPDPDPTASLRERERLFRLPRSSWADYQTELLSAGGGVWSRQNKSITLSDRARQVLGTQQARFTPQELIHTLLQAPVDLLWNGGIGTYVKATGESDDQVGDRTNDAVRVNGRQLRCRAVGEGGNLGLTQAARVEFALEGGLIHTDFIDNSGGVDCSDHEVNIKILLDRVVAAGDLTGKQRDGLLRDMTDEVAALVLADNRRQSLGLALVAADAERRYPDQCRMVRAMEQQGQLDRTLDGLPDDEQMADRQRLTTPEHAVLSCHAKLDLFRRLSDADFLQDPFFVAELRRYFPRQLGERFAEPIAAHRLAADIIATVTANDLVNRMGDNFIHRLQETTNADPVDLTRAYVIAREVFSAASLWDEIEALPIASAADADRQLSLLLDLVRLLERATRRLLQQHLAEAPVSDRVAELRPGVEQVIGQLPALLEQEPDPWFAELVGSLEQAGLKNDLATRIALLGPMVTAIDVVQIGAATGRPLEPVCLVYFGLNRHLGLHWLHQQTSALADADRWAKLARNAMREELYRVQRAITAAILSSDGGERDPDRATSDWLRGRQTAIDGYRQRLDELKAVDQPDLAMLSVAAHELSKLVSGD